MICKDETEIDGKEDEESDHGEVEAVELWQDQVPCLTWKWVGETVLVLDALYYVLRLIWVYCDDDGHCAALMWVGDNEPC